MTEQLLMERLFEALITGDRPRARGVVETALTEFTFTPQDLITELFWPMYEQLEKMHRADDLSCLAHHMATRLLRVLTDQVAQTLDLSSEKSRTVFCGFDCRCR